jgi:hypothetical protein
MRAAVAVLAAVALGIGAGVTVGFLAFSSDDGETPPGQAAPEPPPPQCNHENTRGCEPGAEIEIVDSQWRCRGPLADYAEQAGGTLPLKVTARFTTFVNTSGPVIDLREGCTGDGTQAIDLILDVQGDGRTRGGVNDGLSVKLTASEIDITGNIDCGPRLAISHQDGVQAQGGSRIAFVDLEVGDWDARRATCTGASGGIDISEGGIEGGIPSFYECIRCRVVACRRALNVGISQDVRIIDSSFRSGNPAEREEVLATGVVGLCSFAVDTCWAPPTVAVNRVLKDPFCDAYPYESRP